MREIHSVGIVIPAHNEAALIGGTLDALERAAAKVRLRCIEVRPLVVLDRCSDRTRQIVEDRGTATLSVDHGNVGAARAAGFAHLTAASGIAADRCWFASTDADTRVDSQWLAEQVRLAELGADAVFGVVDVDDWSAHSAAVRDRFHAAYRGTRVGDPAGHRHVHGASMGIRASAYHRVGGFASLAVGEDQALSDRLERSGDLCVVRSTRVRATTSARTNARAPGGFSAFLSGLGDAAARVPATVR